MNFTTNENIVIVAHKFLTQPDDDLVLYLNKKSLCNVLHIRHGFSDAPDRKSSYTWYKRGEIHQEGSTRDYKELPEFMIYIKEFYFTRKWISAPGIRWRRFIGMDGLCVSWGNFLRMLGLVDKTIFWAIDFVPLNRFQSRLKNTLYHFVNTNSYQKADVMWDLGPHMAESRKRFLNIELTDYNEHKVVPYGVWCDRIRKYDYDECDQHTLVFMGHLMEKQGVQLVLHALSGIVAGMSRFRFKIIGGGAYKETLTALACDLNILQYCDFMGKLTDIRELENEIAKSCLAIAPYIRQADSWTYHTDAGKVKTYIACGVPVLLTDVPWNAHEIEKEKCGLIIREDAADITRNVLLMMESERNQEFRENARRYSETFNYGKIFSDLF